MPRQFNNEMKAHILARLREGASVEQLAREYEPSSATIHKWRREAQQPFLETGSVSLEEHRRVLQRNAELEETVAILERATALLCIFRDSKPASGWITSSLAYMVNPSSFARVRFGDNGVPYSSNAIDLLCAD